ASRPGISSARNVTDIPGRAQRFPSTASLLFTLFRTSSAVPSVPAANAMLLNRRFVSSLIPNRCSRVSPLICITRFPIPSIFVTYDDWRVRLDVGCFHAFESSIIEPLCVLRKSVCAALLSIDQHVEREEERKGRSGSLVIRYHVYDDYAPARFQSAIETLEEIARRLFAFGMHYVARSARS